MINGFPEETQELNKYELSIVPIIVSRIKKNIGKDNAVKNKDIIRQLNTMGYEKISAARIRKLIHHIRVRRLVTNLIATSKGYYRAESQKELDTFIDSLRQRNRSVESVINSFIKI